MPIIISTVLLSLHACTDVFFFLHFVQCTLEQAVLLNNNTGNRTLFFDEYLSMYDVIGSPFFRNLDGLSDCHKLYVYV